MKSLKDLYNSEELFKKVHDAWLEYRLERGDDTPSMVPYDKLPEDVKDFDRITTRMVLEEIGKTIRDGANELEKSVWCWTCGKWSDCGIDTTDPEHPREHCKTVFCKKDDVDKLVEG